MRPATLALLPLKPVAASLLLPRSPARWNGWLLRLSGVAGHHHFWDLRGKKYDDSPLTVLSNHLTMGFEDVEQVDQSAGELSGRGSLERISKANLDGVPVMLATTVVKKDICVFDLILIARPDSFEAALADYRSLRDGFEARFER